MCLFWEIQTKLEIKCDQRNLVLSNVVWFFFWVSFENNAKSIIWLESKHLQQTEMNKKFLEGDRRGKFPLFVSFRLI